VTPSPHEAVLREELVGIVGWPQPTSERLVEAWRELGIAGSAVRFDGCSPPRREASRSCASPWLYLRTVLPFQLAAWACRIGVVYFVMEAGRIEAGVATAVLVVVLNGAATAVPVPGGAGSQQVLATYALQGVVSAAAAVSFSLSMQVGVTAVNTAVGLAAVMLLFRTLRPVAALRAAR
jgi:hypothetical protein